MLNVKLVEGTFYFGDGFALRPWIGDRVEVLQLQGYPTPLTDHAVLSYLEIRDAGLLCFDRPFLARARFLLALVELQCHCRLWFPYVSAMAEQICEPPGVFKIGSRTVLPSYGDLENRPDDEIWIHQIDLQAVSDAVALFNGKGKTLRRVALGLRRWAASRERLSDEDAILDAWIGLESIYIGDFGDKQVPISKRIAQFLTTDVGSQSREATLFNLTAQKAFDWAHDGYGVRSLIVHGENVKPERTAETRWHSEALLFSTLRFLVFRGELDSFKPQHLQEAYDAR